MARLSRCVNPPQIPDNFDDDFKAYSLHSSKTGQPLQISLAFRIKSALVSLVGKNALVSSFLQAPSKRQEPGGGSSNIRNRSSTVSMVRDEAAAQVLGAGDSHGGFKIGDHVCPKATWIASWLDQGPRTKLRIYVTRFLQTQVAAPL